MMFVKHKRVLIVTAKWPLPSRSTDGGDVTLAELISTLQGSFSIHLMAFRDDVADDVVVPGVEKVIVVRKDFANFGAYARHDEEKFFVRIRHSIVAAEAIARIAASYDCVVVIHAMFLLGLSDRPDILSRCLLFPMFTGIDYRRSGERVPSEYIRQERCVLPHVSGVITPSVRECDTLVREYGVPQKVISVVPRIVESTFLLRQHCRSDVVSIAYVASVRLQKDHLSAMRVVKILADRGINVRLRCIGAIQDADLYAECGEYSRVNGIAERILFDGNRSRREVFDIVSECSFNISTSRCETFGRGIREGMAMGVPTLVLQSLHPLFESEDECSRPIITADVSDMAETIIRLAMNSEDYAKESAKGLRLAHGRTSDCGSVLIRQQVSRVSERKSGEIVLVPESALLESNQDERAANARKMFVHRQFKELNRILEVEPKQDVAAKVNWALSCHLVGRHDDAIRLYSELTNDAVARVNWLAFCHRDFCCSKSMQFSATCKGCNGLSSLLAHNLMNCRIACGLKAPGAATGAPVPVLSEHLLNDFSLRLGREVSMDWDRRLMLEFVKKSVVVAQRRFSHLRRRVGFFLTDLQRHQESALLYEMSNLLLSRCDIYVYFSNAFDNKLIRQVAGISTVRNVSGCSLEGVGNLIFDDEIEILVDMAGCGLRNSNVALARIDERFSLGEVMAEGPLILSSLQYYGDRPVASEHGDIVVLGDASCISDCELKYLAKLAERGGHVVYPSYRFNESIFAESFRSRLRLAGFPTSIVETRPCIRPFSRYIEYLSGAALIVVANGATAVELSEALFCHAPVIITSSHPMLLKMAEEYSLPVAEKNVIAESLKRVVVQTEKVAVMSARFTHFIENATSMLMTKVVDRNTRLAYRFGDSLFCFHETCNGDAIVFANGESR